MSLRGTTCRGNPPKGFRSSTIKSLQHKVSDERYLFMGCFDCTSFRSTRHICTLARYCLFALRSSTTPRSGISSNYLDFILRSKISLADRQISLRVLLCTRQGRAVGEGCCGGKRQALSKKVATYLSFVLRHAEVSILKVGKQVTSV